MTLRALRQLHRRIAPIVLLPLLVTAATGITYRLSQDWFGIDNDRVSFLMTIHEGEYLGDFLEPIYVLLNGLGLLLMMATGTGMLLRGIASWFPNRNRQNLGEQQR